MKFIPKSPREGINVSDEHPLKEAALLVVGLTAVFAAIALLLIFLVDLVILAVSPEKEARLLSEWMPAELIEVNESEPRTGQVDALLRRMEAHWPDRNYRFRIAISDDEAPNAFAVPGGLIVVTSGLLDAIESENELAFVIGHELGHFRNRDHLRGIGRGIALSLLFAAISGSEGNADLGAAVADLTLRGFSREQENDADRFGLNLVQAEYGHVAESWRFFERINAWVGEPGKLATYLSTHPDSRDRIADLQALAQQEGWALSGPTVPIEW